MNKELSRNFQIAKFHPFSVVWLTAFYKVFVKTRTSCLSFPTCNLFIWQCLQITGTQKWASKFFSPRCWIPYVFLEPKARKWALKTHIMFVSFLCFKFKILQLWEIYVKLGIKCTRILKIVGAFNSVPFIHPIFYYSPATLKGFF
jgi:hypothetical protein